MAVKTIFMFLRISVRSLDNVTCLENNNVPAILILWYTLGVCKVI